MRDIFNPRSDTFHESTLYFLTTQSDWTKNERTGFSMIEYSSHPFFALQYLRLYRHYMENREAHFAYLDF